MKGSRAVSLSAIMTVEFFPFILKMSKIPRLERSNRRLVDTEAQDFKMFLENFHYIKEDDYQKAAKYLKNPQLYDLKNILGW
jgi:hypothetical protein